MRGGILVRNLWVYIVLDVTDERDGWVLVRYIVGYHLWRQWVPVETLYDSNGVKYEARRHLS
jgi:hypothetical protein